jgi:acyl-CoA reductase-like NAD-dependent aldehyde dehydrogenase
MGPLIDPLIAKQVQGRIEQVMDDADEFILRGRRLGGEPRLGGFVSPTEVANRDTSSSFLQEEFFSSLVVLEKFETEAEARAKHTEFGLSASVWINYHNKLCAEAETGGYRRSGLGRLHGVDALIDLTEIKHNYQSVGVLEFPVGPTKLPKSLKTDRYKRPTYVP